MYSRYDIMKNRTKPSLESNNEIKELDLFKDNEELFRKTFEEAAAGIAHVGLDGNFIRIVQKFCDIVGYSQQEMLKLTFQDIVHPDDIRPDLDNVQMLLDKDIDTYSMEKRYFPKGSTIVWVNLTVSLVLEDNGEPKYFIAVMKDITKRKEKEERFKLLIEQASDGFFVFDYDGSIFDVNRQACKSLGFYVKDY